MWYSEVLGHYMILVCSDCRETAPFLMSCAHTLSTNRPTWRGIPEVNIEELAYEHKKLSIELGHLDEA